MALAGQAIIAIWNDITAEGRANFNEWHPREHMPERVGIPGFRRGRRYIALDAQIEFFTLYEADAKSVLVGKDYKDRLNSPTDWSRRSVGAFLNNLRGICDVVFSKSNVEGAFLFTIRFDVEPARAEQVRNLLSADILPKLADAAEMTGAHLAICDQEMSGTNTSLQRTRKIGVPHWIVMVEALTAKSAKQAGQSVMAALKSGATGEIIGELYQLEYSLAKIS
jgi:hypothetical protein